MYIKINDLNELFKNIVTIEEHKLTKSKLELSKFVISDRQIYSPLVEECLKYHNKIEMIYYMISQINKIEQFNFDEKTNTTDDDNFYKNLMDCR